MQYPAYNRIVAISKDDTTNIAHPANRTLTDGVQAGGAGIMACVLEDNTVVNVTMVAGGWLPIRVKRINSTNTTATVMSALYQI